MKRRNSAGQYDRVSLRERFDEYAPPGAPDECWLWQGPIEWTGYGRLTDFWKKHMAHRLAYEFAKGQIPPGQFVCHSCDVRACVNPKHLWLGSQSDNVQDAIRKGRMTGPKHPHSARGEANVRAKLTEEQVREIRRRYATEGIRRPGRHSTPAPSFVSLAREYGVSQALISNIISGRSWKHVA